jgi:hypothetical protein
MSRDTMSLIAPMSKRASEQPFAEDQRLHQPIRELADGRSSSRC